MQANHLVYVLTCLSYAGAQIQVVNLAKEMKARGWRVSIISMMTPDGLTDVLDAEGIAWASLDMKRGSADWRALVKFRQLIHAWQPTLVHSHMIHANFLARVARLMTRMPVLISTAHNINEGGRLRMLMYRLTDMFSDHTTNVSQAAVERYIKIGAVPKHKISLMPNGINTQRFKRNLGQRCHLRHTLELKGFTWLAVGRLEEQKDYPNMLQAFRKHLQHGYDDELLIVGEGPLLAELKDRVTELKLDKHVRFLGVRSDVAELMNAADAYLMSSAYEGLPMVLLEAAASSLPIVATDVGGNREIVQDEQTGFLSVSQDAKALAAAMLKLRDLPPERRKAQGEAGRAHVVATYDLVQVVGSWQNMYQRWLKAKGIAQLA